MKGFSYPAPTGPYKVCLNSKTNWQDFTLCRIQVSVGNPRYEGAKYQALLEWCRHRFDAVEIIVSDTLQRHNLRRKLEIDHATAWKLSRLEGQEWLKRNPCPDDFKLTGWDDLLKHPLYSVRRVAIDRHYDTNFAFRAAVDSKAEKYGCPDFLLEEIAIFSFLFETPAVDIYAGSWITDVLRTIDLYPNALSVDFTHNKAYAAA